MAGGPLHVEDLGPVLRNITYSDPAYEAWLKSLSPWRLKLHRAWLSFPYWARHPLAIWVERSCRLQQLKEWFEESWWEAQDLCGLPEGYPWTAEERVEYERQCQSNQKNLEELVRALEAGNLYHWAFEYPRSK